MFVYSTKNSGLTDAGRKTTVHIEGSVSSEIVDSLQPIFSKILRTCDHLEVNLKRLKEVDYSFIMLLCATHRTAVLFGKQLTLKGGTPGAFEKYLDLLHYSRKEGCLFTGRSHCRFKEFIAGSKPEA